MRSQNSIPTLVLRDEIMAVRKVRIAYKSNVSDKVYEVEYIVVRKYTPRCPICGGRPVLISGGAYVYPVYYCDNCKALIELASPGQLVDFEVEKRCMFCRAPLREDLTCPRCGAVHITPESSS